MHIKAQIFLLFAIVPALATRFADAQVNTNVLDRVLNVRVNAGTEREATATAFTLDVDGREYLITAKHVVQGLKDEDTIDVFMNDNWSPLVFKIFRCEDPVDIAVLIPPHQLTVTFPLTSEGSFQLGQEAYFLGFPLGIQSPVHGNGPYPFPLIKRGTISGLIPVNPDKGETMLLLDGYNNPGFSGGPIVFRDFAASGYVMRITAVVSGFIPEVVPAMIEHDIRSPEDAGPVAKSEPWRIRKRRNGKFFEYLDNGSYVALNTGIVQGYTIQPALELIRQHPIGPEVRKLFGSNTATTP